MPDHIHLFVTLPPTISPAAFIGQVKGATAYAYNKNSNGGAPLIWQEGYGVITVRKGEADKIVRYVENQQEIHARRKASRLLETIAPEDAISSQ